MNYLYRTPGMRRRVMHIERISPLGEETWRPFCTTPGPFNRSINAPWGLGRPVCKKCKRQAGIA